MPELITRTQYPTSTRAPMQARASCRAFCATWALPAAAAEALALLASELVTNAVTHGRVPGRHVALRLERTDHGVRVEVRDARGDRLPALRTSAPTCEGGRGLALVAAISDDWGVRQEVVGKTVWAEIKV